MFINNRYFTCDLRFVFTTTFRLLSLIKTTKEKKRENYIDKCDLIKYKRRDYGL